MRGSGCPFRSLGAFLAPLCFPPFRELCWCLVSAGVSGRPIWPALSRGCSPDARLPGKGGRSQGKGSNFAFCALLLCIPFHFHFPLFTLACQDLVIVFPFPEGSISFATPSLGVLPRTILLSCPSAPPFPPEYLRTRAPRPCFSFIHSACGPHALAVADPDLLRPHSKPRASRPRPARSSARSPRKHKQPFTEA